MWFWIIGYVLMGLVTWGLYFRDVTIRREIKLFKWWEVAEFFAVLFIFSPVLLPWILGVEVYILIIYKIMPPKPPPSSECKEINSTEGVDQ